jgi:hypothetical protein
MENHIETTRAFAELKITNRGGKIVRKIQNEIKYESHSLSYSPSVIAIDDRRYVLNYPLRCLFEKEEDHYIIKNESLDIYAVGKTVDDVETDFNEEFDNLYKTLTSLSESQLTTRMNNIKKFMNLYVNHVA